MAEKVIANATILAIIAATPWLALAIVVATPVALTLRWRRKSIPVVVELVQAVPPPSA